MMKRHLAQDIARRSKRCFNANQLVLSPSLHHLRPRRTSRVFDQHAFNQNRSSSPVRIHQRLRPKSIYSSSYTSLNSYLKEFNLSEKDFFELHTALKTIFYCIQPEIFDKNHHQRLISPYLRRRPNSDDQSSLPLYTNEYYIRNGLLNHNDGPEIYDSLYYSKHMAGFQSSSPSYYSSLSSVNISLPLTLLSNQKYLFKALTSNYTSEKSRRSQSHTEMGLIKDLRKGEDNESESILIRRNKVQAWERRNILRRQLSIDYSSISKNDQFERSACQRSSIVRTPSINNNEKNVLLQTCVNENRDQKITEGTDNFFPMVKVLAPYIILRDSFHPPSTHNHSLAPLVKKINQHINPTSKYQRTKVLEKEPLNDVLHSLTVPAKRQSLLLPTLPICDRVNVKRQRQRRRKNYLLAEFESVLTRISKRRFL